jgi:putative alpha-1,2-mannosidase
LDSLFTKSAETQFGGNGIDAFAGVQSLYNHGNQPSLHISWMFNFSGKPWLTQKWTRRIGNEFYGTEEIHGYGYGQDEDQGQLGAWYVMSSLGLFDVKGLTETNPGFQFGSPIFDLAILQVDGGPLTIRTHNNGKDKLYINKIEFNGKPYSRSEISFRDLIRGGTLDFWMSASPNKNLFD